VIKTDEYILHLIANQAAIGINIPNTNQATLVSLHSEEIAKANICRTITKVKNLGLLGNHGAGVFWYTAALSLVIGDLLLFANLIT
jgi:hypothetical protein